MAARDDVQRVAAALERPRAGYLAAIERARAAMIPRSGEAARQLGVFVDRVGDLGGDELRELYDETFDDAAAIAAVTQQLAAPHPAREDDVAALAMLARLLERLERDRNPFACLVRALCCLLLARARPDHGAPSLHDRV
jgi:nitrate reductase assembly molybdenum cofactor insertion protein NarJ